MGNFYVYSSEIVAGHLRMWSVSLCFIGFSVGGIFVNFISMFYSDYRMYLWMCVSFHIVPYVFVFFLIETPFFHYKNQDIRGLFESLLQICAVNFESDQFQRKRRQLQSALRYPMEPTPEDKQVDLDDDTPEMLKISGSGEPEQDLDA